MSAIASASAIGRPHQAERISWRRLLWVAPLTVVVSVLVCLGLRALVVTLDPSLARMGQLGPAMTTLALEGAVAAVVVFALFTLFVPRAIFWFRVVGVAALVLSWAPDIALGLGGTYMRTAMRFVGPLATLGQSGGPGSGGPPPGGPPPGAQTGGPPPGFTSGMPVEQVLVLMFLHTAVAVVCVGLLTTLTREPRLATRLSPSE